MEVLISMAVLGLILASSFTLANRSTYANRAAGERSQAAKLAEQQIELLKIYMTNPTASLPDDGDQFCLNVVSGNIEYKALIANMPDDPNENPEFATPAYPTECSNYNGLYNYYIQRGGLGSSYSGNTFTAVIRWEAPNGKSIYESTLVNRIYASDLGLTP